MKEKHFGKVFVWLLFVVVVVGLVAISFYSNTRYVGDTALYGQITQNIAQTGKAESNIFANTQDFIDRAIAAIPIEERLASDKAFEPPVEQTRNILRFHSCFILYVIAPLCYFMSAYSAVTLAQAVALAFSLYFCILMMREKEMPIIVMMAASILLVSHPGWSMPAIYGAFYPERLFMGTGMYLAWACEKERFSKVHFFVATILCMSVGERGALYAGMFILAHTIFYWRENLQSRKLRLISGGVAIVYCGIITKFFLENLYYSNLAAVLNFGAYLSVPHNVKKVVLFLIINVCLFLFVAIFDWRAFVIGAASMIPNLLYDNGGAEKIGWTLHYHVFYFVFLMWAVTKGIMKLYQILQNRHENRVFSAGISVGVAMIFATLVSVVNPTDSEISWNVNNIQNNVVFRMPKEIVNVYVNGGRDIRIAFNELIKDNVPVGATVSTVEAGMCALDEQNVHLFPMGIKTADMALVSYYGNGDENWFGGSVVYLSAGDQKVFDDAVVTEMRKYGYNFEEAIIFPPYGLAIVPRDKVEEIER